jgi:hypothetical protein
MFGNFSRQAPALFTYNLVKENVLQQTVEIHDKKRTVCINHEME